MWIYNEDKKALFNTDRFASIELDNDRVIGYISYDNSDWEDIVSAETNQAAIEQFHTIERALHSSMLYITVSNR